MSTMNDDGAPDAMETASETPYMRRPRAVAVRQSRIPRSIRRIAWWSGMVVFVLIPLGAGSYLLGTYLANSPRFLVSSPEDVSVEGNHYVSKDEVLAALGLKHALYGNAGNIFKTSLDERERRIESIPWVKSATIVRSYPHNLTVYIAERTPIAFVNVGGKVKLVDQQGVLLDPPEKGHFDFPIVNGLDFEANASDRAARLNLYQEFMQETSGKMAGSGWNVSEVDLSDVDNLKALLVQDGQTLLVYFGDSSFAERFDNLMTVLPQLRRTNARIDSVDLRFRNQVVVNPADQDSAGASSGRIAAGKTKRN
jgi:cell division protein FtsQ